MTNDVNYAYRESEALTTDPVGLVLVSYDMLLKDLREAVAAIAGNDIERRGNAVRHSLLILQQLQSTLDMERGGVVAQNLERFYNYMRAKLLEGQIKISVDIFEQQITFVSSIREAWEQVRTEQQAAALAPKALSGSDQGATTKRSLRKSRPMRFPAKNHATARKRSNSASL